jgi:hypothetical protein
MYKVYGYGTDGEADAVELMIAQFPWNHLSLKH